MAEHETLAEALAAFQAELPKLYATEKAKVKTRTGGEYEYAYADLAEVTEKVSPVLGKHGLSFNARPTVVGNTFGLVYELRHEKGEKDEGFWPLPNPRDTPPQEIGSAITYARRYCFLAVTNTFPAGADDDGRAASDRPTRPEPAAHEEQSARGRRGRQREQAGAEPVAGPGGQAQPATPAPKTWTEVEVRDMQAKLTQLDIDKAAKLYDWMAARDLHNRPVSDPQDAAVPRTTATRLLAVRLADTASLDDTDIPQLDRLRDVATDRGLLKVQVSETESLDQVLSGIRAIRNAERLDTEHAVATRQAAEASWSDTSGGE